MIISKNAFCLSSFEKNEKIVRSIFKGRADINLTKEHLEELGDFYLYNKVNASIVDITGVYGSYVKILDYIRSVFLPKTKVSGIRFKAYVVSNDVIVAHLSTKLVEGDELNQIPSKVFSNLTKAEDWVGEKLKTIVFK